MTDDLLGPLCQKYPTLGVRRFYNEMLAGTDFVIVLDDTVIGTLFLGDVTVAMHRNEPPPHLVTEFVAGVEALITAAQGGPRRLPAPSPARVARVL